MKDVYGQVKTVGGDEVDALNKKTKKSLRWKAGERKRIKNNYNQRNRKTIKENLKDYL